MLAVKGNQKRLYNDIKNAFEIADSELSPFSFDSLSTLEKDHGRIEMRKYDICYEVGLLEERYNWPKLTAFGRVTSTRETATGTTTAIRYFIASRALTPESFIAAVRGHWSIKINFIGYLIWHSGKMNQGRE